MNIDWSSFAIGAIAGAVFLAILRLHVLKKLDVKLDKLGIGLGIEGFEKPAERSGVTVGNISGSSIGDIVGGDKKTNNYYKNIQAAVQQAIAKRNGVSAIDLHRPLRLSLTTNDPDLLASLRQAQSSGRSFEEYCRVYMESDAFARDLQAASEEAKRNGWEIKTVKPVDNLNNGLLVEATATRPFPIRIIAPLTAGDADGARLHARRDGEMQAITPR
jgi:hypothetical protein